MEEPPTNDVWGEDAVRAATALGERPWWDDEALADVLRLSALPGPAEDRAAGVLSRLAGDRVTAALRQWEAGRWTTLAAAGWARVSVMSPEPDGLLAEVEVVGPLEIPDLPSASRWSDEGWWRLVTAAGLRSALIIPLYDDDGRLGHVLALYADGPGALVGIAPGRLDLMAQAVLAVLAGHATGAVEPADHSDAFQDAVAAMHVDRDPDDVCQRAVDQIGLLTGADWVLVARSESPQHQQFDCHLAVERLSFLSSEAPLLYRVATTHTPLEDPVGGAEGDLLLRRLRAAGIVTSLWLPLTFQGTVYGVVQVGYRISGRVNSDVRHLMDQLAFHLALALRDASLVRTQEVALSRLRDIQQDAMQGAKFRALAQMAGGVAHEFNNALGGILARAQMLQRQTQDRRILKGLTTISEIGWRAAETVRRLQEFTRERSEEDFEPLAVEALWVRLSDAVRQQVAAFSRAAGARYHVELESDRLTGNLQANCEELIEAVGNVVCNALEATPGGGVVMLHASAVEDHLHLTVVDRGRGMSAEELQSCFDPFYSTKNETGVGLGLSVTYGIVARHCGEVEIDSAPGRGTTVSMTLPLIGEAPSSVSSVPHVLVIDDEPALCEVLGELFSNAGYTVESCAGGREGIERFQTTHFDLVCTDLRTEDLSGWEVIRAVKESGRGTPVMLLTGFREQLRQDQIEESGVDAVMGKPFTLQQVMETAQRLLAPGE